MALEYDLKRGEEVWLLLNKETAKFTNSIMNLGLTFQDLQSLIAHERYDLGGQYGMSPILA